MGLAPGPGSRPTEIVYEECREAREVKAQGPASAKMIGSRDCRANRRGGWREPA